MGNQTVKELRAQNQGLTARYDRLQDDQRSRVDGLVMQNQQLLRSMEENNQRWQCMLLLIIQAATNGQLEGEVFRDMLAIMSGSAPGSNPGYRAVKY